MVSFFPYREEPFAMNKFLNILSVLLLFGLPFSQTALGEELGTTPLFVLTQVEEMSVAQLLQPETVSPLPVGKPQRAADVPFSAKETRVRETGRPSSEALMQTVQEFRAAVQSLQQIAQRARTENNPLARELNNAVQNLQRTVGTGAVRPAGQSSNSFQNTARNSLHAEREKTYIELARQYFYVFAMTPVEVPAKTHTASTASAGEEGRETGEEAVPNKSKREGIFDNFTACMKKISPAAQMNLIQELIRSATTNEELKLLEDLLDEALL
jgi:hypothetical protein